MLPELDAARNERVGCGIAARDPECRRLDHGQRAQSVGVARSCEERDHAAIRMPDEMRSRLDALLEPHSLVLEVDALDVRAGREAAPVRRHEIEALLEGPLRGPRDIAVDDTAVHEEDAGTADPAILWIDTK